MLIHKDALAINDVTSKDDFRYFLHGALFDAEGRAVATDGHLLVRFAGVKLDPADFPRIDGVDDVSVAADVVVPSESLNTARVGMKSRGTVPALNYMAIIPNGQHVTVAATDLSSQVVITANKPDGSFPAYERILQATKPTVATVILGAGYLELIGRIAKKLGVRGGVSFTFQNDADKIDNENPVFFTAQCENGVLDGAIMPMRK